MLNAIGPQTAPYASSQEKASVGLQALLLRLQKELSDCINCDTANTRAGRDTIQNLSGRINALKARMETAELSGKRNAPVQTAAERDNGRHAGNIVDVYV